MDNRVMADQTLTAALQAGDGPDYDRDARVLQLEIMELATRYRGIPPDSVTRFLRQTSDVVEQVTFNDCLQDAEGFRSLVMKAARRARQWGGETETAPGRPTMIALIGRRDGGHPEVPSHTYCVPWVERSNSGSYDVHGFLSFVAAEYRPHLDIGGTGYLLAFAHFDDGDITGHLPDCRDAVAKIRRELEGRGNVDYGSFIVRASASERLESVGVPA